VPQRGAPVCSLDPTVNYRLIIIQRHVVPPQNHKNTPILLAGIMLRSLAVFGVVTKRRLLRHIWKSSTHARTHTLAN